jgi:hypothetical protein
VTDALSETDLEWLATRLSANKNPNALSLEGVDGDGLRGLAIQVGDSGSKRRDLIHIWTEPRGHVMSQSEPLFSNVAFRNLVAKCAQDPQFVTSFSVKCGDELKAPLYAFPTPGRTGDIFTVMAGL